jgi:hypothetical protein
MYPPSLPNVYTDEKHLRKFSSYIRKLGKD